MSKQIRLEIRTTVLAYVGEDIAEDKAPDRDPDAVQSTKLVRVAHCRLMEEGEAARGHVLAILSNAAPVLAERVCYDLKAKR